MCIAHRQGKVKETSYFQSEAFPQLLNPTTAAQTLVCKLYNKMAPIWLSCSTHNSHTRPIIFHTISPFLPRYSGLPLAAMRTHSVTYLFKPAGQSLSTL
ncbi:hypothetical protein GDO86_001161 [Hymenochirus boettgeri]|uniref:Uncharacterized protein n=1 Tax=Hymenochirus boettgeri TaxID=247094 RepID=A0A8T2KHG7_9PIPI|nr:hypothetical protein GDO86_001161 [Hymenochirus boettgeri]